MTRLNTTFNWGNTLSEENPDLYRQLSSVYADISSAVNDKVNKYVSPDSNPPSDSDINKNFDIGDVWIRKDNDTAWTMTSRTTAEAVTWSQTI